MYSAIAALLIAAGWRVFVLYVPALSNFSPVMALAFCAGAYCRRGWFWFVPFTALILSDVYINHYYAIAYHYELGVAVAMLRILCFAAALGLGTIVYRRRNCLTLFAGALSSSVLFFLATNTASWIGDTAYIHDAAGWWQAITVGHPQYYPTLFFLRNSVISDLLFTGCLGFMLECTPLCRFERSLLALNQAAR